MLKEVELINWKKVLKRKTIKLQMQILFIKEIFI